MESLELVCRVGNKKSFSKTKIAKEAALKRLTNSTDILSLAKLKQSGF
jgi:hypothetical protein